MERYVLILLFEYIDNDVGNHIVFIIMKIVIFMC